MTEYIEIRGAPENNLKGYMRYIAGTEQEHSVEILAELLSVIHRLV